jgi:putative peptidoglycan lipid II flippase
LLLIIIVAAVSRTLGFVRESVIAAEFGTTSAADSIYAAMLWPTYLSATVASLMLTIGPPIAVQVLERDGIGAVRALLARYAAWLLIPLTLILACLSITLPTLVRLAYPAFPSSQLDDIVALARLLAFAPVLSLAVSTLTVELNARRKHVLASATTAVGNAAFVAAAVTTWPALGIYVIAVATISSLMAQLLIQLAATGTPREYRPERIAVDPETRRMLRQSIPILAVSVLGQASGLTDQVVVSRLASGNIAALSFANRLNTLPVGLLVDTSNVLALRHLSTLAASAHSVIVRRDARRLALLLGAVMVPVVGAIVIWAGPLTDLAYRRGAFTAEAASTTSTALQFYALSLPGIAASAVLMSGLLAMRKMNLFLAVEATQQLVNVGTTILLAPSIGFISAPVGTAMAYTTRAAVAFVLLGIATTGSSRSRERGAPDDAAGPAA